MSNTVTANQWIRGTKKLKPKFKRGQVVYIIAEKRYAKIIDAGSIYPNGKNCYEPGYHVVGDEGLGLTRYERGLRALTEEECGKLIVA